MIRVPIAPRATLALCVLLGVAPALAVEVNALTSPDGTPFLHAPMPDADTVSVRIAWPSAWAYAEEAAPAAPAVGGDLMLAGGAGKRSPAEVWQALDDLGIEVGLYPSPDHVVGVVTVPTRHLDAALDVVPEMLDAPAFDERWFERLRDGFAADVGEAKRRSRTRVQDALVRLVLGDAPLERALTVKPASLAAELDLDDVRRWYGQTFARRGVTAVVAGGIDAEAAGTAVDAMLAGLPEGDDPAPAPAVHADFSPRTVLLHAPDSAKSAVALTGRLPPASEGGETEDAAAVIALAGGTGSSLFDELRTRLRAAYDVDADLDAPTRALRALVIYAEVDPDKVAEASEAMRRAYEEFRREGPPDERVAGAKRRFADELREDFASSDSLAFRVMESALDGYGPGRVPGMIDVELGGTDAKNVRERLGSAWPAADDLIEVVLSADPDAVPGACVVESTDALDDC